MGEEAAPHISSESTLTLMNLLLGKAQDDDPQVAAHRRISLSVDKGVICGEFSYGGEKQVMSVTAVCGIFISKLHERVKNLHGDVTYAFSLPPSYDVSIARAIKESCVIAGVDITKVVFVDSADSLVATYGRKLMALKGPERSTIEVRLISIILVELC